MQIPYKLGPFLFLLQGIIGQTKSLPKVRPKNNSGKLEKVLSLFSLGLSRVWAGFGPFVRPTPDREGGRMPPNFRP